MDQRAHTTGQAAHGGRPPASAEELTAEWLEAVLEGADEFAGMRLAAVRCEPIGAGRGFTSQVLRVHLEHAVDGPWPAVLVAKLAAASEESRGLVKQAYLRESVFYRQFQAESPLPSPRCYHVEYDADSGRYALLLEDVQGLEGGDQIEGTTIERARHAVEQLARLHARFWRDPRLIEALGDLGDDDVEFSEGAALFQRGLAELKRAQSERYPRVVEVAEAIVELITTPGLNPKRIGAPRPPSTLLHGDYRLDNLFFGGAPARPMLAIDWVVRVGRGGIDLAYFMAGSLTADQLREHEASLIQLYLDTLAENGVEDYGKRRLLADYEMVIGQMAANQVLVQVMLSRGRDGPGPEDGELERRLATFFAEFVETDRGAPLFEAMIERVEAALELHPRVRKRVHFARRVIIARSWLQKLVGRGP